MINYKLVILLEKVLGSGKPTSGTNYAFFSPFCSHYKQKLEINLETLDGKNPWHCWISNEKGKTIYSLFKKLNVDKHLFDELNSIVDTSKRFNSVEKKKELVELPNSFIPLSSLKKSSLKNPSIKNALLYLKNRGVSTIDILRYNIGVCDAGEYANMVIIPSYDFTGNLNYFVARSIFPDTYIKYKNPNISKNIIPFDLYINWDLPIILTEGVFDAMAARFNAIPLLGKSISSALKEKIIVNRVSKIYIALDSDAIKDSLRMIKYFLNQGISVNYVNLGGKDPSEVGQLAFHKALENSEQCSFESLIKMELIA
jgi:DNA primase